jgi:Fe2+ transport system protein FeoA
VLYPLWTAKPGSGCTTIALALAVELSRRGSEVLLVDLDGDLHGAAALPRSTDAGADGLTDWLAAGSAGPEALRLLEVAVTPRLSLLPRGTAVDWPRGRDVVAHRLICNDARAVVVDVGTVTERPDSAMQVLRRRVAGSDPSLLVTRSCYLALRRAEAVDLTPTGVVLVREAGRSLDRAEVARHIGAPVVARIDHDAAVARALDAGLLARRPPRPLARQVRRMAS